MSKKISDINNPSGFFSINRSSYEKKVRILNYFLLFMNILGLYYIKGAP